MDYQNKKKASIRWGIIGCGNVTEIKSGPAYKLTDGFEIAAVMRRDEEKLKSYAKRHEIPKYYTSADHLINDPEIDAIYIATPPDTHKYYALKVAKTGKPCCIEKPLSPSYIDSLTIYETFKQQNIPLFVAYYRRSLPRFKQIATWLKNNDIGKVRSISWHLHKKPSDIDLTKKYNWRTDPTVAPGGYFDDLASHGIDLFTQLLGEITEASGVSSNQQNLYKAPDAFSACWVHKNGVTGSGIWNFGSSKYEDSVEINGSKGNIKFAIFHNKPLILSTEGNIEELIIENPENIQLYHVENMKKHLTSSNYTHPSTGETALHTSWIMDKILGKIN